MVSQSAQPVEATQPKPVERNEPRPIERPAEKPFRIKLLSNVPA
jgi:hypothetical protein